MPTHLEIVAGILQLNDGLVEPHLHLLVERCCCLNLTAEISQQAARARKIRYCRLDASLGTEQLGGDFVDVHLLGVDRLVDVVLARVQIRMVVSRAWDRAEKGNDKQ